jgi:RNA polymerase sigma factor (sigma-70 family)
MTDDQALLIRYTKTSDAMAFAELVNRYSALVFSIANRMTGTSATAEDVTQDCFFALASHASTIRGSLPAWLHRTAMNRSLDVMRSESVRKRYETDLSGRPHTTEEIEWKQIAPLVDEALEKLPAKLKEPLIQHFLLGRCQTEIAKDFGINQSTISRRIELGIDTLRAYLKQSGAFCGVVVLPTALAKNATVAVPQKLYVSLMKMAIAGPPCVQLSAASSIVNAILTHKIFFTIMVASSIAIPVIFREVLVDRRGKGEQYKSIATSESLSKGMVLHFSFDRAELNGKVTDLSGKKNDGKATGVRWTREGKIGGAFEFKADGDQIEVANNDSLNPKRITLAAWIKTTNSDRIWRRIFDKSYTNGYALSIGGYWPHSPFLGRATVEIGPDIHFSVGDDVICDGKWHHIIVACDGTEQRLYVDGKQQGETLRWNKPGRVGATNFNLVIGCNRSNLQEEDLGMSFRGLIDEPMIWNRALSPEEIAFLYESQANQ